jgi:hypothetical protein
MINISGPVLYGVKRFGDKIKDSDPRMMQALPGLHDYFEHALTTCIFRYWSS